MEVAEFALNLL